MVLYTNYNIGYHGFESPIVSHYYGGANYGIENGQGTTSGIFYVKGDNAASHAIIGSWL